MADAKLEFEQIRDIFPQTLEEAVAHVTKTPLGYAYVLTAVQAAYARVGLGYAWNKWGKEALGRIEEAFDSHSKKEGE